MKIEKLTIYSTSSPGVIEAQNKINELIDALNSQNKEVPWEPKDRETYWFLKLSGDVESCDWLNDNVDRMRRDFLGIYQTEALALEVKERIIKLVHGV